MKIYDIVKKHGIVTKKYPLEPYKVEEFFRGKPKYNYDLCIGCAACGVACPSNAITVKWQDAKNSMKWQHDSGRCIFCGRCDEVCPTGAVVLSNDYELAVKFDKSALLQIGELEAMHCKECGEGFLSKKFVEYSEQKIDNSNLSQERKNEAKIYLHICPKCKQNKTLAMMINKEYGAVK